MPKRVAQLQLQVNAHQHPEGSSVGVFGSEAGKPHDTVPCGGVREAEGAVVTITAQGELGRARVRWPNRPGGWVPTGGGKRQAIQAMSDRSRGRLRDTLKIANFVATMAGFPALFMSVSYPDDYPAARSTKEHLFALRRRIEREFGPHYIVWRLGIQKRGAPHYHFMVFGVPWLSMNWLRGAWGQIIGYEGCARLQVDVRAVRSAHQVANYLCKYEAKADEPAGVGGAREAGTDAGGEEAAVLLETMSYLAVAEKWNCPGRFWGEWRKALKVLAEAVEFDVPRGPWFYKLKKWCTADWIGEDKYPGKGFRVYMPAEWFLRQVVWAVDEADLEYAGAGV